ncbi:ATP-binding protein [Endozoicomonas sp. SCSIO W0465]|uniref:ATP-binding protein n=1 Tax=Endozoicomonas sp. SCSIO W0465 TaxID=2918516 RepID=UPI0020755ABB|nr:ATP-binding protein [Endozoicomonas sp. SCSIO W0465]USE33785.1 ATP-binding protein [Endozoicomonas sp. SCSIO W0465]
MDEKGWQKRYEREKLARLQAEKIAEEKTREIYYRNLELKKLAESLEEQVKERTHQLEVNNSRLIESRNTLRAQQRELRDINQRLQDKATELEKISQHQSQFLANVSHELRTPLNSLMILTSMLAENHEGNLTADQVQSVQIIFNSANELLEIIEDILDMSRVEAGELSIHYEDIILGDIWRSLTDQFMPVSKEKAINFEVISAPDLPEWIHTDRKRLKQILKNLLANAFKFTAKGGSVRLLIHKETWRIGKDYSSQGLVFQVTDTGIGIPRQQHETVFHKFKQVDGSSGRKYGGTGLGLSISRKLARMLEGELTLESEEGKGSTFSLLLPPLTLVTTEESTRQVDSDFFLVSEEDISEPFSGQEVLLVDDDLRNSFALSRLLESHGLRVHLAENGQQALDFLKQNKQIDLLLLDLMMPEVDGCEVLRRLRGMIEFRLMPVIILTASALKDDEMRCRAAGADDYLQKPVETRVLMDHIRSWIAV